MSPAQPSRAGARLTGLFAATDLLAVHRGADPPYAVHA
jgi:hypothetical protein